jgi:hypothetical protein
VRLTIVRGERPYPVPRTALLAGALLVALGVATAALPGIEDGPVACPFRAVTGLPCPTCGLMRTTHYVTRGEVAEAFALNPFDALFLLVAVPVFAVVWVANRVAGVAVRVSLSRGERRAAWALVAAAVLANWVYVLLTQR